jgi:hypothetical protein
MHISLLSNPQLLRWKPLHMAKSIRSNEPFALWASIESVLTPFRFKYQHHTSRRLLASFSSICHRASGVSMHEHCQGMEPLTQLASKSCQTVLHFRRLG